MATTTFLSNATFLIGAVDLSDQCRTVTLTVGTDQLESTAMGDTGHKFTAGLQTVDVSVDLLISYGVAEVEATLNSVLGTNCVLTISPSGPSETPSNPEYTITNAFLSSYSPINSSVGELASTTVTFTGGTFARDITP